MDDILSIADQREQFFQKDAVNAKLADTNELAVRLIERASTRRPQYLTQDLEVGCLVARGLRRLRRSLLVQSTFSI